MSRGFMPGLFACALLVALAPVSASAQATGSGSAVTPTPVAPVPIVDPAPSAADDNEARDLFEIGKDAFDEGRFDRALKYFQEAYQLSHRAALLSNIGTAFDRLRRDQEAVDAYRKYLEQLPQAPNRHLIEERIRIIEAAIAKSQPAPPAAAPVVTPAPVAPPPAAAAHEPLAPTPAQTARAAQPYESASDPRHPRDVGDTGSPSITSRWWFWTGIGAVAVAAVVVVVAVSAGGGERSPERPTLLDPQTRVREL
jgi:tetratricopeptide (TPR) repeat protein